MKILIADDHYLIVKGMAELLAGLGPDVVCVEATTARQALERLDADIAMAVLDLTLPDASGVSIVEQVRARRPDLPVLVISAADDPALVRAALDAGARGYVQKARPPEVMLLAARTVLAGDMFVPSITLPHHVPPSAWPCCATAPRFCHRRAVASMAQLREMLTERQFEVARLLPEKLTNKEIGRRLDIDANTVKVHLASVFRALRVNGRGAAIAAIRGLED